MDRNKVSSSVLCGFIHVSYLLTVNKDGYILNADIPQLSVTETHIHQKVLTPV